MGEPSVLARVPAQGQIYYQDRPQNGEYSMWGTGTSKRNKKKLRISAAADGRTARRRAAWMHLGPARPDIAPDLRYFPVRRYLILYRQITDGIEIVRVVHGARDVPTLMADN